MFFPYMSTYMHLLGGRFGQRPKQPWDEMPEAGGGYGTFGAKPWDIDAGASTRPTRTDSGEFHGFGSGTGTGDSDANADAKAARRRALGSGLLAFGTSMLEAAPRGDWGGGLARGAAGFGEAMAAEKERVRRERKESEEEKRRQAQEERAQRQDTRAESAADLDRRRGEAELTAWQEQQQRGRELRTKTGKSAEQMVAEIQSLASANPNDPKLQVMAKRAVGYALGEDSDLNKLADLHEQMTGEAFKAQDYSKETEMGIGRSKARQEAGVDPNVRAAERRANAELDISRGHLDVARQNAANGGAGVKQPTPAQRTDDIMKRAGEILKARQQAAENGGVEYRQSQMPGAVLRWRQEAIDQATREIDELYKGYRRLRYDPKTGTFSDM